MASTATALSSDCLKISGIDKKSNIKDIDTVFRVFRPINIELIHPSSALVRFKTRKDATDCREIISMRPDLLKRKLGEIEIKFLETDVENDEFENSSEIDACISYGKCSKAFSKAITNFNVGKCKMLGNCNSEFEDCMMKIHYTHPDNIEVS